MLRCVAEEAFPSGKTVFQTPFWAYVKEYTGWKPLFLQYKTHAPFLSLLARKKGVYLLYIPALEQEQVPHNPADFQMLSRELRRLLPKRTVCIRYDSRTVYDAGMYEALKAEKGLNLPGYTTQPADTVLVKLSDEPWKGYRKRAKRRITSAAQAASCYIPEGQGETDRVFSPWYELYRSTAQRAGFLPRSREYLTRMLNYPGDDMQIKLFCVFERDSLISGAVVAWSDVHACYLYGASSERGIELSAMYLLQDCIIRYLHENNRSAWYDLYGIAPQGDPAHPLRSLSMFKTAFGGEHYTFLGIIDYPCLRIPYRIFVQSEYWRISRARKMSLKGRERT